MNDLVYTMGPDAEPVIKSFKLTAAQEKNYDHVIGQFNTYFVPKVNVIHERAVFIILSKVCRIRSLFFFQFAVQAWRHLTALVWMITVTAEL